MELILNRTTKKAKRVTVNGRKFLVVPATMIVPGVLPGSKGALYYPPEEVAKNFASWNDQPLTANHPSDYDGNPISAHADGAWEKHGIGYVQNARIRRGNLIGDAWFDIELTKAKAPNVLNKLLAGEPVELSTGLFTQDVPARNGSVCPRSGRPYSYIATNYRPDHLAVLLDTNGACSLKDGCGIGVVNANPEGCNQFKKCGGGAAGAMDGKAKRVVKAVKKKVVEKYKALVGRYGKVGAAAVLAGWMAPMPGAGPIATGIAEAVRFLGKRVRKSTTTNAAFFAALNLSLDDMVADAVSFFQELYAEFGESAPEIDQDTIRSTIQNELIRDSMTDNISQMSATVSKLTDAEPLKSKMLDDGFHHHFISSDPETAARKTAKKFSGAKVEGERGIWSVMVMMGEEEHMFHFLRPESVINHTKIHENLNVKTNANPAQNSKGDSEMKLTQAQRSEIVSHLTTNCDCWKGKGDDKVLNAFPDDKLIALKKHSEEEAERATVLNAVKQGFTVSGVTFTVNNAGTLVAKKGDQEVPVDNKEGCEKMMKEEGDEGEEETTPTKKKGLKMNEGANGATGGAVDPALVANAVTAYLKQLTPAQKLDLLGDDMKSAVNNAMRIERRERDGLVARLVANVSDPTQKANLTKKLSGKSLEDLNDMVSLLPTANQQTNNSNPDDLTSYFGAAGGGYVAPTPTINEQDVLPLPGDPGYLVDNEDN